MSSEYEKPRPLSSVSQFDVFRYLSFKNRRHFAKKCPQFRKVHSKYPFCLSKVQLSYAISDESICFKFIIDDAINWSTSLNWFIFPSGTVLEKRECINFDDKVISFYLNRKGTQISELYLNLCQPFKFTNFYPLKISNLSLSTGRYQSDNGQGSELFRNLKLKRFEVDSVVDAVFEDFQKLNIRAETLMIWSTSFQGLSRLDMIPHEKFIIWDRTFESEKFLAICKDLKNNAIKVKNGCSYGGKLSLINIEGYMSNLQKALNAEVKYISGGIFGYCVTINQPLDLFIIAKEMELDPNNINTYLFEATVQDFETAITFRQLSFIDKLRYWNNRKNCWVLKKLRNYIIRQRLARFDLSAFTSKDNLTDTIMWCSWLNDYHMLFPVALFQVIVLLIMSYHLISYYQVILIIICFCLFATLDFFAFRPWRHWRSRSGESVKLQTICPV